MSQGLDGHKLLILKALAPGPEFLSRVSKKQPGLEIVWHNSTLPIPLKIWDNVTVVCTWDNVPSTEETPKLRLVQLTSSGANHCYGHPQYLKPNVHFYTTNGIHPPQITEWEAMKEGSWIESDHSSVEDSVGLRVGILGYGAISRHCARVAKAFGMDVVVYTMREKSTAESRKDDSFNVLGTGNPDGIVPSAYLNDFLAQDLDLLIICLPLTASTTNLISAPQFEILSKRKTFVSNIARGKIVNTTDLIDALENGKIRGAAVDVTGPEPSPKDHVLWKAKNVFVSPHVSWHSKKHNERLMQVLELNLERLSEGKPLVNLVDKYLGF